MQKPPKLSVKLLSIFYCFRLFFVGIKLKKRAARVQMNTNAALTTPARLEGQHG